MRKYVPYLHNWALLFVVVVTPFALRAGCAE